MHQQYKHQYYIVHLYRLSYLLQMVFKFIKDITWDVAFHCPAREMTVVCKLFQKTKSTYDILWELKGFVSAGVEIDTVRHRIQAHSH